MCLGSTNRRGGESPNLCCGPWVDRRPDGRVRAGSEGGCQPAPRGCRRCNGGNEHHLVSSRSVWSLASEEEEEEEVKAQCRGTRRIVLGVRWLVSFFASLQSFMTALSGCSFLGIIMTYCSSSSCCCSAFQIWAVLCYAWQRNVANRTDLLDPLGFSDFRDLRAKCEKDTPCRSRHRPASPRRSVHLSSSFTSSPL